jgi:hypothetical protein
MRAAFALEGYFVAVRSSHGSPARKITLQRK